MPSTTGSWTKLPGAPCAPGPPCWRSGARTFPDAVTWRPFHAIQSDNQRWIWRQAGLRPAASVGVAAQLKVEIGRASCRERGEGSGGGVCGNKKRGGKGNARQEREKDVIE